MMARKGNALSICYPQIACRQATTTPHCKTGSARPGHTNMQQARAAAAAGDALWWPGAPGSQNAPHWSHHRAWLICRHQVTSQRHQAPVSKHNMRQVPPSAMQSRQRHLPHTSARCAVHTCTCHIPHTNTNKTPALVPHPAGPNHPAQCKRDIYARQTPPNFLTLPISAHQFTDEIVVHKATTGCTFLGACPSTPTCSVHRLLVVMVVVVLVTVWRLWLLLVLLLLLLVLLLAVRLQSHVQAPLAANWHAVHSSYSARCRVWVCIVDEAHPAAYACLCDQHAHAHDTTKGRKLLIQPQAVSLQAAAEHKGTHTSARQQSVGRHVTAVTLWLHEARGGCADTAVQPGGCCQ